MRRILTENLLPGMVLAKSIYSADGNVLLGAGMEIKESYIERLINLGITAVYIYDEATSDVEIRDVIDEQTRREAVKAVRDVVTSFTVGKAIDAGPAREKVNEIVDELFRQRDILVHIMDLRAQSDYTFAHMVNVCVLAVITGMAMGYDQMQLRDMGTGAVLHDLGKVKISPVLYNKPGRLKPEEFEEIQKHTLYGFEILRQIPHLNVLCAHVAYQHHERYDGKGYPRRLKGNEIHEYARIVAVADVYDALTAERPYRRALLPYQAVEYLIALAGTQFDPDIVDAFIGNIAIYPVGSMVELNNKQRGIVIAANKFYTTRPVVRIIIDADGNKLAKPKDVDLMQHQTLFINYIIEE